MRLSSLPILAVLACGAAFAARLPETFTYVDGTVTGLAPKAAGTMIFTNQRAIELRSGNQSVMVPYAGISKAELGETKTHAKETEPVYKVWALHKRIMPAPETQLMTVAFTNLDGQEQTMTLEVPKHAAEGILEMIQDREPQLAKGGQEWWGDSYWKTNRNKDQWGGTGTLARK